MNLYADTSGLAKIVLAEPGSDAVAAALRGPASTACAAIGYVELRAAVAAAIRQSRVAVNERDAYVRRVESVWGMLDEIPIQPGLIRRAGNLAEVFGLRAYDAVHLAALQAVGDAGEIVLVCWDWELRAAAAKLGYELLPEELCTSG